MIDSLMDVEVEIKFVIGDKSFTLIDIKKLEIGEVIDLKNFNSEIKMFVNNSLFAICELIVDEETKLNGIKILKLIKN